MEATGANVKVRPRFIPKKAQIKFSGIDLRSPDRFFCRVVREGLDLLSVWDQLRGPVFLGRDGFLARMQKLSDQTALAEIPRAQRRP